MLQRKLGRALGGRLGGPVEKPLPGGTSVGSCARCRVGEPMNIVWGPSAGTSKIGYTAPATVPFGCASPPCTTSSVRNFGDGPCGIKVWRTWTGAAASDYYQRCCSVSWVSSLFTLETLLSTLFITATVICYRLSFASRCRISFARQSPPSPCPRLKMISASFERTGYDPAGPGFTKAFAEEDPSSPAVHSQAGW